MPKNTFDDKSMMVQSVDWFCQDIAENLLANLDDGIRFKRPMKNQW